MAVARTSWSRCRRWSARRRRRGGCPHSTIMNHNKNPMISTCIYTYLHSRRSFTNATCPAWHLLAPLIVFFFFVVVVGVDLADPRSPTSYLSSSRRGAFGRAGRVVSRVKHHFPCVAIRENVQHVTRARICRGWSPTRGSAAAQRQKKKQTSVHVQVHGKKAPVDGRAPVVLAGRAPAERSSELREQPQL